MCRRYLQEGIKNLIVVSAPSSINKCGYPESTKFVWGTIWPPSTLYERHVEKTEQTKFNIPLPLNRRILWLGFLTPSHIRLNLCIKNNKIYLSTGILSCSWSQMNGYWLTVCNIWKEGKMEMTCQWVGLGTLCVCGGIYIKPAAAAVSSSCCCIYWTELHTVCAQHFFFMI